MTEPVAYHALTTTETARRFAVTPAHGLTDSAVTQHRVQYGENRLQEKPPRSRWLLFLDQFRSLLIGVLLIAAVLAGVIGDLKDALVILIVVLFNALLGFWQEYRADTVLSLLITLLVAHSGWRILKETSLVLLESAPRELDTSALAQTIRETEGVASFHDLHAWRISDGFDAVTVHVVLAPRHHGVEVSQRVCQRVEAIHGIRHVTVQPEAPPPDVLVQLGRSRSAS